jgi:molybdopterin converting factor small subunit
MRVEFLGLPRDRTGVPEVELKADTLGQLLDTLAVRFPTLNDLISDGWLSSSVVANLNGDCFVRDRTLRLKDDDCVLILSADAGG